MKQIHSLNKKDTSCQRMHDYSCLYLNYAYADIQTYRHTSKGVADVALYGLVDVSPVVGHRGHLSVRLNTGRAATAKR